MSNLSQSTSNRDGIFNFINTLGRREKKKAKELEELEVEGKSAMDNISANPSIDTLPEDYILGEFEERRMIHPSMNADSGYQSLKHSLVNWINDELRWDFCSVLCQVLLLVCYQSVTSLLLVC